MSSAPGPYARLSDEQLVHRLAEPDALALGEISDRHARPLYSLALRMLEDQGWAEEVVQDVLFRLWSRPSLYDPARGELRTWLLTVTHHAAVDALRGRRGKGRRREQGTELIELYPAEGDDPAELAWRGVQAESVRAAVDELPEDLRQLLELAYYEGMTQTEIASHLGQPLGTVKSRVRAAMGRLREALRSVGTAE